MMFPFISVLIGISLVYYIRQRKRWMRLLVPFLSLVIIVSLLVLETCVLSYSGSLIVKFV